MPQLFQLGRLLITPAAMAALERTGETALSLIARHVGGDWGTVGKEDHEANQQALKDGSRIFSAYKLKDGTKVWVITEATINAYGDRQSTCVLLPSDY